MIRLTVIVLALTLAALSVCGCSTTAASRTETDTRSSAETTRSQDATTVLLGPWVAPRSGDSRSVWMDLRSDGHFAWMYGGPKGITSDGENTTWRIEPSQSPNRGLIVFSLSATGSPEAVARYRYELSDGALLLEFEGDEDAAGTKSEVKALQVTGGRRFIRMTPAR